MTQNQPRSQSNSDKFHKQLKILVTFQFYELQPDVKSLDVSDGMLKGLCFQL